MSYDLCKICDKSTKQTKKHIESYRHNVRLLELLNDDAEYVKRLEYYSKFFSIEDNKCRVCHTQSVTLQKRNRLAEHFRTNKHKQLLKQLILECIPDRKHIDTYINTNTTLDQHNNIPKSCHSL